MAFDKKFLLATTFIAGFAIAGPVLAQAQPTAAQAAAAAAAADDEDDADSVEEVVVTGSRIRRNEFTAAAPITVITAESARLEGLVDTAELLRQTSAASGNGQIDNQLTGFVANGGGGAESISLRGLGANRTLILMNGRRLGPTGTRGAVQAVDPRQIPFSLVERVEILKDGASSVYGSDAVAGVINIITKTNLDGIQLDASVNRPFEEGGGTQRYAAAWGQTFDRGYFNVAADYFRRDHLRRGQREATACAADYLFDATTMERLDFNGLDGETKCYNLSNNYLVALQGTTGGSYGSFQYREAGVTYPAFGTATSPGGTNLAAGFFPTGLHPSLVRTARAGYPDTYPYYNTETPLYDRATAVSGTDIYTLAANGAFDLTPNAEVYTELLYQKRISEQDGVRQLFPQIRSSNPNARQPDGTLFGINATSDRIQPVIALTSDNDQEIDYLRGVVGIRGSFGDGFGFLGGWDWDLYGQYSDSSADYTGEFIYRDRMNAVGDVRDFAATSANSNMAGFNTPCFQNAPTANTSNPGNVSGYSCASLPGGIAWSSARILRGDFNDAERAFLFSRETGNTTYTQAYVEGVINGDLFTLPAGVVGAAFGFHIRKEEINDTPGINSQIGNYWGSSAAGITAGSDTVKELFGEVEVPLVRGVRFIESATLSLSGRYSDYESYGSSETYKVGLNWQISPAWRIRATHGTSFRAPALYEQFLGNQTGFQAQSAVDACVNYGNQGNANLAANCASLGFAPDYVGFGSSATIITGGGRGVLTAETADATTVGVIWTPSFIDLSVAVDYFDISVDDEVRQFGSFNIVDQCMRSDNFPNDPFCTLFTRDPATGNNITVINNSYVNVASQINSGIDLTVRYGHEFGFGDLVLDGQFTWQLEDVTTLIGGAAPEDNNGTTLWTRGPDFTGNFRARFTHGDWTAAWRVDMIGKGSDTEQEGADVFGNTRYDITPNGVTTARATYYKQYTEFSASHTVSLTYQMDDWTFLAGVRNVFGEETPNISPYTSRIGTAALSYPIDYLLGRQAFFTVTKRF